jgi:predicted transcriptional regulator
MSYGKKMKNSKQIEKHIKGVANHRRIDILLLISKSQGITLDDIAKTLDCNFKTISGHTLKLVNAGLVDKNYNGRAILHSLSPYGKIFVKFIINFKKL